jgi:hypothetical protein
VSYGGSSLVANYVIVALLLRISQSTSERLGEVEPRAPSRFRRRLDPSTVPAEPSEADPGTVVGDPGTAPTGVIS